MLYWRILAQVTVRFVRRAASAIPEHWRTAGLRSSLISGTPRHAVTPFHAVLNYLYSLAETEVSIAVAAVGLDPTIGVLHADSGSRASFTLDILDALRPEVDRYALTFLSTRLLSLHDVGELPSGVCRLRPAFASALSETASHWRSLAVPIVEEVASMLRAGHAVIRSPRAHGSRVAAVPGSPGWLLRGRPATPQRGPGRCPDCGGVSPQGSRCATCGPLQRVESVTALTVSGPAALARFRAAGSDPAHGPAIEGKRAATQQAHRSAAAAWNGGTGDPARWERLRSSLASVPLSRLRSVTGYSLRHCGRFRAGEVVPHPRVWEALERLCT